MNWDAVGAISEAVGALGVIITLIYLATQIRQNSRTMDQHTSAVASAAEIAAADQSGGQFMTMAQNSELADIIYRGNQGRELSPLERARYDAFWLACLGYAQNAFLHNKRGYTGKASWRQFDAGFSQYMKFAGVDALWRQQRTQDIFDPEFVACFNTKVGPTQD
jgi:hypothetical protein